MDDKDRAALMAWIAERRRRPLAFGRFDCATLCADYLMQFHGMEDPMADLRGSYATHEEAMALVDGAGGMKGLIEQRLGAALPMARCEAGAIVYGEFGDGPALGICAGHNVACVGARGLTFHPLSRGEGCWLP